MTISARDRAVERLAHSLRWGRSTVRTPWHRVRIGKPPLLPVYPELRRLPSQILMGETSEHLLHLWEQATYGFLASTELNDEGFSQSSWAKAFAPFAHTYLSGYRHRIPTALYPILLFTISCHVDHTLDFDEGVVVTGGSYDIGVRDGKVVSKHSNGVDIDFDLGVLMNPMPGHVVIDHPVLLVTYAKVRQVADPVRRKEALDMLSYIVFHDGQKEAAQRIAEVFDDCSSFLDGQRQSSLPTEHEIEDLLFNTESTNAVRVLKEHLMRHGVSYKEFRSAFGNDTYVAKDQGSKRYDLLYRYRDFLRSYTSC